MYVSCVITVEAGPDQTLIGTSRTLYIFFLRVTKGKMYINSTANSKMGTNWMAATGKGIAEGPRRSKLR